MCAALSFISFALVNCDLDRYWFTAFENLCNFDPTVFYREHVSIVWEILYPFFFWNFHSSPRLFIWENSKRIFVSFYLESYRGWTFGRSFKYYSKQVFVVRISSSKLWKRFDTNANGGWNFSRVEYLSVFRIIFLHLTTINPSTCVTPSSSSWSSSLRTFNLKLAKKNLLHLGVDSPPPAPNLSDPPPNQRTRFFSFLARWMEERSDLELVSKSSSRGRTVRV